MAEGIFGRIYIISNDVNEKLYIGKTTKSIEKRFKQHARTDSAIGSAMRKYGIEHFQIGVIENCYTSEQLNACEVFWIAMLNTKVPNGYNLTDGGDGTVNLSEESRVKISAAQLGNKHGVGNKSNTGRKLPAEQCEKMSASRKIFYAEHPELVEQIGATLKALYEEHPEKAEQISEKLKAYLENNPEALQQRIETLRAYRKTHPELSQQLAKLMLGNTYALGYKHTAEAKAKISAASKAYWARKRAQENQ